LDGASIWLGSMWILLDVVCVMGIAFGDTIRGFLFLMKKRYVLIFCITVINQLRDLLSAFYSTFFKYMLMFWWSYFEGAACQSLKSRCMCKFLHLAILKIWSRFLSLTPKAQQWPNLGHCYFGHVVVIRRCNMIFREFYGK
jgi:hypothetical protein